MSHIQARQEKPKETEEEVKSTEVEPSPEKVDVKTPSWFTFDLSAQAGEALAERYNASRSESQLVIETPGPEAYEVYRRQLDEKFTQSQRLFEAPQQSVRRPTLPLSDIHGRRRLYEQEQRAYIVQTRSQKSHLPWGRILGFGLLSIIIGGTAGFGFANRDSLPGLFNNTTNAQVAMAGLTPGTETAAPHINQTTIQKKTVAIASLDVNDVRGTLNSMIPLMLTAQSADINDPVAVKIMGLPKDAYLTAGVETTEGNWLVKTPDLASLKMVVPQSTISQFDIEVAAVEERTGVLAAPIKAMSVQLDDVAAASEPAAPLTQIGEGKTEIALPDVASTIAPANAMPDGVSIKTNEASIIPEASPEARQLISKADGLLNSGDIASARQFYLKASELGDANGAYGVGRTYDPQVFAALNVQGLKPDPTKAADWYQKALDGGVRAAQNALSGLPTTTP
jgi:hypothetical protein